MLLAVDDDGYDQGPAPGKPMTAGLREAMADVRQTAAAAVVVAAGRPRKDATIRPD
ncbi:hypothetical protein [Streptomyces sp. NPDC002746]